MTEPHTIAGCTSREANASLVALGHSKSDAAAMLLLWLERGELKLGHKMRLYAN